jgi:glycosyltransferase involved in cell wall biosynthesis
LEQYRRQAFDLQILDYVTFTGRVPYAQAPAHLSLGDVAVSAKRSVTEANGKLLDYMAMGLPTVAYDTPIAREVLGELGVLVPVRDVAALAEGIQTLLDDRQRRATVGPQLRLRAERLFSWDALGQRLETTYSSLCLRRAPSVSVPGPAVDSVPEPRCQPPLKSRSPSR